MDQRNQRRCKIKVRTTTNTHENTLDSNISRMSLATTTAVDPIPNESMNVDSDSMDLDMPGIRIRSRQIEYKEQNEVPKSYNTVQLFQVAQIADRYKRQSSCSSCVRHTL